MVTALLASAPRALPTPALVERDIESRSGAGSARTSPRSRSSSSASGGSNSRPARPRSAGSSTDVLDTDVDGRHGTHGPRRRRSGCDQLPLAVRPAARARLPRPDDGHRGRRLRARRRHHRAGRRCATPSPTSRGSGPSSRSSASRRRSPAGPLATSCRRCASSAGVILIVMGLSLAGILPIAALERTWRPLDAGAPQSLATATGSIARSPGERRGPGIADRLGGRLVDRRAAGWRRSASGRSSPSAGRRASASSSAAS